MATHKFNLLMPDARPSAPYNALDRYDTSLSSHQPLGDEKHPVEVMRHHIIPDTKLKEFWNKMVTSGNLVAAADGFLNVICSRISQYKVNLISADRDKVKLLVGKIRSQEYQHDGTQQRPEGFDNLAAIYEWLPGNLFVGPKGGDGKYQRTDDPGNNFERNSDVIVGSNAYNILVAACLNMREYLLPAGQVAEARTACIKLAQIAQSTQPFDVKKDNWRFSHQTYKINAPDKPNPCDLR
jgi:hypothetical protein